MKPKLFCFVTITAVMSMMGTNEVKPSPQQLVKLSPQQVEHRNRSITINQQLNLAKQELAKVKAVGKINELKAEVKLLEAQEVQRGFFVEIESALRAQQFKK